MLSAPDFSLFSIVLDIFYYGFFYLLSFCPFPDNIRKRTERKRDDLILQEKMLLALSSSSSSLGSCETTTATTQISIIIPSYNEETHLEKTLLAALVEASHLNASLNSSVQVEIIVSDGGSKDSTEDICASFADRGVVFMRGGSCRAECQNIGKLTFN
jgi:cellulose synthase/poly-beta-1,6-N-acetylglucosamine synthase-like glycosyltransferase